MKFQVVNGGRRGNGSTTFDRMVGGWQENIEMVRSGEPQLKPCGEELKAIFFYEGCDAYLNDGHCCTSARYSCALGEIN